MKSKFVSLWLAFAIIIIFIIQIVFPGFTDTFILNMQSFSQLWRFVTSIFLHAGFAHLLYNLFALVLFGLILESLIGSNKFLVVFFSSGIFANIISVNFYPSSLGASGAIFGIIGTLAVLRPLMLVWAFSIPMPMFIAAVLWAAGDILGIFMPSNTANIAHLSGLALGAIAGFAFRMRGIGRSNSDIRHKRKIPESHIRRWEDSYLR